MMAMNKAVREYLSERGRIAGKAGRGEAKRKGARASWTKAAREKRKAALALKQQKSSRGIHAHPIVIPKDGFK